MRKQMILLGCAAALILASGSYAQDKQPFLGVLLDESPLPELLTKHLRLEPGAGIAGREHQCRLYGRENRAGSR